MTDVTHRTVHVRRSAHAGKGLPTYDIGGTSSPCLIFTAAWEPQTVCLPTLERALPLPACDRRSKQALTLHAEHQLISFPQKNPLDFNECLA